MLNDFPATSDNTAVEPRENGSVVNFPRKDKGTSLPDVKKKHWVTIEFDEDADHYRITSSFKAGPQNYFLDGFTAYSRFKQYVALVFQACEDYRRKLRSH